MAEQEHLSKTLNEHQVIVAFKNALIAKELAYPQRLIASQVEPVHRLREPEAAKCLEVAEEAIEEARDRLMGRKV